MVLVRSPAAAVKGPIVMAKFRKFPETIRLMCDGSWCVCSSILFVLYRPHVILFMYLDGDGDGYVDSRWFETLVARLQTKSDVVITRVDRGRRNGSCDHSGHDRQQHTMSAAEPHVRGLITSST
jgi:hypothetical protein